MRWNRPFVFAVLLACAVVALLVYRAWDPIPSGPQAEKNRSAQSEVDSHSNPVSNPPTNEIRAPQVTGAFGRLLERMKGNDTVDFGAIANGFADSGFSGLASVDMLRVLDAVDFGSPVGEFQGPAFLLESAAEVLRDRAGEADVMWVAQRLRESSSDAEIAKWMKTLDLMSCEQNQAAYIELLKNLPEGEPEKTLKAEAELVGRVLGQISSEQAVAALLAAATDERTTKQLAVDSSIGYVQDQRAIKPIAELIDGAGAKTQRQLAVAVGMLGYIPSEYSVMSLRNLSSDSDEEIAGLAKQSLKLLMSNNPGLESVAKP